MAFVIEPKNSTPTTMYCPNSNHSFVKKIDFMMVEKRNLLIHNHKGKPLL
jgi:hypothetical protein